jgi:nucleotide-binding universal stress UspA family protein
VGAGLAAGEDGSWGIGPTVDRTREDTEMRILLAIDGSPCSDAAVRLAASRPWPAGTSIRVVAVEEPSALAIAAAAPFPGAAMPVIDFGAALSDAIARSAVALADTGLAVDAHRLEGRAASVILAQAVAMAANLVIVGSRGLGRVGSALLGSVSAEVADKAPCPVLVARHDTIDRTLVAVDGSPSSWRAVDHVAGASWLASMPVEVLAVQPESHRVPDLAPEVAAARAAERLRMDGMDAHWTVRRGDPVHEIVATAEELGCDLVAVGTRGETGLSRLVHGSVAHGVLLQAHASVLVVREPVRERTGAREPLRVGVPLASLAGAG